MECVYVYVLDYTSCSIYEISIPKKDYDEIINLEVWLFQKYNIKDTSCSWMVSDKKLEIKHIEELNKLYNYGH